MVIVALNSVRPTTEIMQSSFIGWPRGLYLENFGKAWSGACISQACDGIRPFMWNSALIAVPSVVLSCFFGAMNGYAISLWRFKWDNFVFGLILFGVFVPSQLKLIPWSVVLRDLGLYNNRLGLILILVIQGLSFTTLFCRNYYLGVPNDIVKAAKIDGAGFYRIFFRVILPVSAPIIVVTVIWQFTMIWNDYIFGVTFLTGQQQPVTAAIVAFSASLQSIPDYGAQSAAVLIAALPTLAVYLIGGKYFARGLIAGAVK
jgi:glucose/mannose transport system permease protein